MSEKCLVSFDLRADFGFFKKPDYNDGLLLSYNMLHKPALLGILGAIIGLQGYDSKGVLPEYYQRLSSLPVGIAPLEGYHNRGNFEKTVVKYTNTVGYANKDGNLLIEESMLIRPAYRCYLLLDPGIEDHVKLHEYLKNGQAEYIPYLGKNEYPIWFGDTFQEYGYESFVTTRNFKIDSLFIKERIIKNEKVEESYSWDMEAMLNASSFTYFERLPVGFDIKLMQYEMAEFAYSDWILKAGASISNLYLLKNGEDELVVQLF